MFNPFGDFDNKGYLQNLEGLVSMEEVKVLEHSFFEANLAVIVKLVVAWTFPLCCFHKPVVVRLQFVDIGDALVRI